MGEPDVSALIREAERLRVEYLAAVNRNDMATALRIGAEELVPVSEQLAEVNPTFNDPFGMTLMNLSVPVCAERPAGAVVIRRRLTVPWRRLGVRA